MTSVVTFRADLRIETQRIAQWYCASEGALQGVRIAPKPGGVLIGAANGIGAKTASIRLFDVGGLASEPCTLLLPADFLRDADYQARLHAKRGVAPVRIQIENGVARLNVDWRITAPVTLIDRPFPSDTMIWPDAPIATEGWSLPSALHEKLAQTIYALGRASGMSEEDAKAALAPCQPHDGDALVFTFPYFEDGSCASVCVRGSLAATKAAARARLVSREAAAA